jgi:DNA-binding NtrC family response regulator
MESELFGHEKGSFTGADKGRIGKFEAAGGGTIFLDEIGETSQSTQVKILRVLQEREITKIGSNKPIKVNCRIICATNRDLGTLVQKGEFRDDLYYRLIGLPIHLPELKYRDNDIIVLAKHFITAYCEENGLRKIILSEDASKKLLGYDFPGNVRELKSVMELACVMTETNEIKENDLIFNKTRSLDDLIKSNLSLKEINEKIIIRLLNNTNNNILKVADQLKIGKSTIYRLLKELKLENNVN